MDKNDGSPVCVEIDALEVKQLLAVEIRRCMRSEGLSKPQMARRMRTSRSQLDRVLDPKCITIQLDTLVKAAGAVGQSVEILFHPRAAESRT